MPDAKLAARRGCAGRVSAQEIAGDRVAAVGLKEDAVHKVADHQPADRAAAGGDRQAVAAARGLEDSWMRGSALIPALTGLVFG